MKLRSYNSYDRDANSVGFRCVGVSKTVQSQKNDADINVLVKRFGLTGVMPEGLRAPSYGDFSAVVDFQSALNAINEANYVFMRVPAEIRARFDNDPQKFMEFCMTPDNLPEMRKMGLAVPEVLKQDPPVVPVVAPVVPPAPGK